MSTLARLQMPSTTVAAAELGLRLDCSSYGDSEEVSCGAPSCACGCPGKVCYGIHGWRISGYRRLRCESSFCNLVRPRDCGIKPRRDEQEPVQQSNVCWG